MTSSNIRFWEGEEWEKHIQLLLKRHYGVGNYQEVPAKHVGDFGIEGYSTDGCVFQCYATEEPRSTQERYEAQRNKITTDIGKFVKNKPELIKLFGTTQIKRWILIVPLYDSATLVQHASKKSEEVLKASLPYIANDFQVIIQTDSCFAKEKNELASTGSFNVDIENTSINLNARYDWITQNQGLIDKLIQKASKIPKLASDNKIEDFKDSMIDHYLRGQSYLDLFNNDYPDLYAQLVTCKRTYELQLQTLSLINESSANQYVAQALEQYALSIRKTVPNMSDTIIQALSWEGLSDWLMRCPLDF